MSKQGKAKISLKAKITRHVKKTRKIKRQLKRTQAKKTTEISREWEREKGVYVDIICVLTNVYVCIYIYTYDGRRRVMYNECSLSLYICIERDVYN